MSGPDTYTVTYRGTTEQQILKLIKYSGYAVQDIRYEGKVLHSALYLAKYIFVKKVSDSFWDGVTFDKFLANI